MIPLDVTELARKRHDEFLRQAAARRLAATAQAARRQQPDSSPVRWLWRFVGSFLKHDAAPTEEGVCEQ
jgi:hypothetical protein